MAQTQFVLITGCGPDSIGAALTQTFLQKGLHVIATVLPVERRDHLLLPHCHTFDLDVTDDTSVQALERRVGELTDGRLDILVNNAGLLYTMPAVDNDIAVVERLHAVNVIGPMRMVRHFHRYVMRTKGLIINTGSTGGVAPYTWRSAYNASKAALHHYGNTLRVEMQPFGVRVMNVLSGEIGTNLVLGDIHREVPPDSVYQPIADTFKARVQGRLKFTPKEEYARKVVDQALRASQPAYYWCGATSTVTWLFYMFLPQKAWDFVFWRNDSLEILKGSAGSSMND